MNPFALPGPVFLVFYIALGVLVNFALYRYFSTKNNQLNVDIKTFAKDPYKIAFLRGGKSEATMIGIVALHDRGLLDWDGTYLTTQRPESVASVSRPIEKALLSYYLSPNRPRSDINTQALKIAFDAYTKELGRAGLLATSETYLERAVPLLLALACLVGTSWWKIHVAFAHGHKNIAFLVILTIVFSLLSLVITAGRVTSAGKTLLANLKSLFSLLKHRAKKLRAGGETNEAALVAAVFGLTVLSGAEFPFIAQMRASNNSGDSGSGCGSSSSSCGSSCGGGCGGCGG